MAKSERFDIIKRRITPNTHVFYGYTEEGILLIQDIVDKDIASLYSVAIIAGEDTAEKLEEGFKQKGMAVKIAKEGKHDEE